MRINYLHSCKSYSLSSILPLLYILRIKTKLSQYLTVSKPLFFLQHLSTIFFISNAYMKFRILLQMRVANITNVDFNQSIILQSTYFNKTNELKNFVCKILCFFKKLSSRLCEISRSGK